MSMVGTTMTRPRVLEVSEPRDLETRVDISAALKTSDEPPPLRRSPGVSPRESQTRQLRDDEVPHRSPKCPPAQRAGRLVRLAVHHGALLIKWDLVVIRHDAQSPTPTTCTQQS